jgi:hypothetical protein
MFYSKCSLPAHSLKLITNRNDGRIRLSEDDNPPAHEFLVDDHGDDNGHLNDTEHVRKATQAWREPNDPEEGQQNPPKSWPTYTSLNPISILHQLEAKDFVDMPYGDETWTTEFVGLAMERGGNAQKVYTV